MKSLFIFATCLVAIGCSVQRLDAQTLPKDQALYDTIQHMDGAMFDAFNHRDLETLKKVFAENVEFYTDGGGVSDYATTIANFKAMFERNANTGLATSTWATPCGPY